MSYRYKTHRIQSDNGVVVEKALVTAIEKKNVIYKNKYKNVFYCKNCCRGVGVNDVVVNTTLRNSDSTERLCIAWGEYHFNTGDILELHGRFNGAVFIVRKLYIVQRGESGLSSAGSAIKKDRG